MKKIIFICYEPLIQKTEKNFYINDLINDGFQVEYWDITNIYFKNIEFSRVVERDYVKKIDSFRMLKALLEKEDISNVIFILIITYSFKALHLYKILSQFGGTLFFYERGMIPIPSKNRPIIQKIFMHLDNILNFNFKELYSVLSYNLVNKICLLYKKLKIVKEFDLVFAAGSAALNLHKNLSKTIPINHFDFDNYLLIKDSSSQLLDYDYCVFLDDNLIFDPDFKILNIKPIDPEKYYRSLNTFFDLIENKLKMKVVIAAHPKSIYDDNVFGKRKVYKDKTNELVKDCVFAIAHYSTSIAYAVLFKKPVLFIYTKEMKRQYYFNTIINFARILNCNVYNIDSLSNKDQISLKEADLESYNRYKYNYLTSKETEKKLSRDIVLEYLKRI